MSHRFIAHVLSSAAVAIGPNSKLFGSKLHATNHKGLDSLQALFLCVNPRVARGAGRLPCGCHLARMRRNGPFPGQPILFSLFALRVVARPRPVFTRVWRGLSVVNHARRLTDKPPTHRTRRPPAAARSSQAAAGSAGTTAGSCSAAACPPGWPG